MSQLVRPTVALHKAWPEAHDEWGDGPHEDGFGLMETNDVRSSVGFRVWPCICAAGSGPRSCGSPSTSSEAGRLPTPWSGWPRESFRRSG